MRATTTPPPKLYCVTPAAAGECQSVLDKKQRFRKHIPCLFWNIPSHWRPSVVSRELGGSGP